MSLYIMAGNGEFLLNNRLSLCQEIIRTEKEGSKRRDMWFAGQISENQDDKISNQIGDLTGYMLETDDNMVKHGQQTALSVTRLIKSFHAFYPASSKVI